MSEIRICPYCNGGGGVAEHWHQPRFLRCRSCRLILRYRLPDAMALGNIYASSYHDPELNTSETGGTTSELATQYVKNALVSIGQPSFGGARVMEFGAGRGALSAALAAAGANIIAVDPYAVTLLHEKGIQAVSDLKNLPEAELFDGVISIDVIEHLMEPWKIIEHWYQRLKPYGWLIVSTCDPKSLRARIQGARWREAQKPGHLMFFEEVLLVSMLERSGFTNVRRLRWRVRYPHRSVLRRAIIWFLQSTGLEGELRLFARKPAVDK